MFTTSSQEEQKIDSIQLSGKSKLKIRDSMIVHVVDYIMPLSISNCCAAINIHLFKKSSATSQQASEFWAAHVT
jgi:hypothetical protein